MLIMEIIRLSINNNITKMIIVSAKKFIYRMYDRLHVDDLYGFDNKYNSLDGEERL